ncbi:MAG TPA: TatD family hydrolase [Candidatus Tyrphobacter sp.]|nr:TatD family hydrolase [Candidatus Tyrphobacter sp.]
MPYLVDSHTHVQFAAYTTDADEVIGRSLAKKIWLINVGTQKDTSRQAVEFAEKYEEGVYAAVGLHPIHTGKSFHDSEELGDPSAEGFVSRGEEFDADYYRDLAVSSKVVAVGECGLDYFRLEPQNEKETKRRQTTAFERQIEFSKEIKKPLAIHCREAFADLIAVLESNRRNLNNPPGVVHFFTGAEAEARKLLELGFGFSFGGVLTITRDYDEVVKYIPLDRILLETDAPYVAPVPYRGKRNEPAYVEETAKRLALIKNIDLAELAEKTTENSRRLFKI